jgi:hypothetical protein
MRQMDERAGCSKIALATGVGAAASDGLRWWLEADDGADGDTRAIGGAAGTVEADVIDLRAQCEVGKNTDIHAAAKAVREVGVGAAAITEGDVAGACQELHEGRDLGRVAHDDAWTEHERVGVYGNAAGRGMVAAEVTDDAQIGDGLVGDGAADAVLVEVCAAAQVEIRIADGGVGGGLGARRQGEKEQAQAAE